jgi:hypothetical protein
VSEISSIYRGRSVKVFRELGLIADLVRIQMNLELLFFRALFIGRYCEV